jgi:hypothetical protein
MALAQEFTNDELRLLSSDPQARTVLETVRQGQPFDADAQRFLRNRLRAIRARANEARPDFAEGWAAVGLYAINPINIGVSVGGSAILGAVIGGIAPNVSAGQGAKAGALVGLGIHGLRTALAAGLVGFVQVVSDDRPGSSPHIDGKEMS